MLGMAPVGAADMKGYDTWVAAPRPKGMKDVGSRQSPSMERIAALKPDLIVVPDYRSTKNLSQLKRIAPVLVTHPYPASGSQLQRDDHGLPAARRRGRPRQPRRARAAGPQQHARAQQGEAQARGSRGRAVAISTPGGTSSAPAIRMFTTNSATADMVRRLGLRDGWSGTARYGFATIGLEGALARERLARVRLPAAVRQAGLGHHAPDRVQAAAGREGQARAHAGRDDVAVRRPALDDAVRRPAHGGAER